MMLRPASRSSFGNMRHIRTGARTRFEPRIPGYVIAPMTRIVSWSIRADALLLVSAIIVTNDGLETTGEEAVSLDEFNPLADAD